jgi:hypothetical protein
MRLLVLALLLILVTPGFAQAKGLASTKMSRIHRPYELRADHFLLRIFKTQQKAALASTSTKATALTYKEAKFKEGEGSTVGEDFEAIDAKALDLPACPNLPAGITQTEWCR